MSAGTIPLATISATGTAAEQPAFPESIWRSPLAPLALAATAGVLLDRYAPVPLSASLLTALVALAAWGVTRARPGLSLVYLGLTAAAVGAAYHHWHVRVHPADDVGHFTRDTPQLVRLRGILDEEPAVLRHTPNDPLRSYPGPDPTFAVLRATALRAADEWLPAAGRVRVVVAGPLPEWHVGDEIEAAGWLEAPQGPSNPGEVDGAALLRDQRIRAVLRVGTAPAAVVRLAERWPHTLGGWLAVLRGWGRQQLQEALPEHAGVAAALLLGDNAAMTRAEWEKYVRTGVVHVLAISGQHLMVLAVFLWWLLRLAGVRERRAAWFIALFLLGYALLAGGRAPVLRAAVMVCVGCGALILRRPVFVPNAFAAAWLVVLALNPTDMFTAGCQVSFLATAVLYWGASRFRREPDPLEQLVEESRPAWERFLRRRARELGMMYLANLLLWLAITPLMAAHLHLVPGVALVIGPPLTVLTSVALIGGFLVLALAPVGWLLTWPWARLTSWSLAGCEELVRHADQPVVLRWYVGDIPAWWLWGFYLAVLGLLVLRTLQARWRWLGLAGAAWLCVGLVGGSARPAADEFRCTFLAVGHGGCVVLETPDGRTLLYDAGALSGPDVTRRFIAPYLWHRGVRRIDELLVSHADLDHFNGIPALVDRFAVGQVTWTPSFKERATPGVGAVLRTLEQRRIPSRVVSAGDLLRAGEITLEVLHPPEDGPAGNENTRSLVLLVEHTGHRILLTGDLEGPGLARVLNLPPTRVDVLMAPHHGSRASSPAELAAWARPKVVVSSQGVRQGRTSREAYESAGVRFLETSRDGAITFRSTRAGLTVTTFRGPRPGE